jgi:hypothetical protein
LRIKSNMSSISRLSIWFRKTVSLISTKFLNNLYWFDIVLKLLLCSTYVLKLLPIYEMLRTAITLICYFTHLCLTPKRKKWILKIAFLENLFIIFSELLWRWLPQLLLWLFSFHSTDTSYKYLYTCFQFIRFSVNINF